MRFLIKKYIINTISVYLISQLISAVVITGEGYALLYSSLILSLLLLLVKPIINLIMFPLNLITLNLSSWIINIIIVYLWIILVPGITINYWQFTGGNFGWLILSPMTFSRWQVIILTGILLTLTIRFLNWILK